MSTSTLGTPLTREEAKKITGSSSERILECQTDSDCPGDGRCVNGYCQCVLDCGNRLIMEYYDNHCEVKDGSMFYDANTGEYSASC